jgi:hypothetical protein
MFSWINSLSVSFLVRDEAKEALESLTKKLTDNEFIQENISEYGEIISLINCLRGGFFLFGFFSSTPLWFILTAIDRPLFPHSN